MFGIFGVLQEKKNNNLRLNDKFVYNDSNTNYYNNTISSELKPDFNVTHTSSRSELGFGAWEGQQGCLLASHREALNSINKKGYNEFSILVNIKLSLIFIFVICLYVISLLLDEGENESYNSTAIIEIDHTIINDFELDTNKKLSCKTDTDKVNTNITTQPQLPSLEWESDMKYNSDIEHNIEDDDEFKENSKNKYIGLEDIRHLWCSDLEDNNKVSPTDSTFSKSTQDSNKKSLGSMPSESPTTTISSGSTINNDSKSIFPTNNDVPFTPFTPSTLDELNTEIFKANALVKEITNKIESDDVSEQDKRKLSGLLEQQEYFINQHKYHLNSIYNNDNKSLSNVENMLTSAENIEKQVKDFKENINSYKNKLNLDITKHETNDNQDNSKDQDLLKSTRKVSDGNWKQGLTYQEINAIKSIDNKTVKDTVKNRIDISNSDACGARARK